MRAKNIYIYIFIVPRVRFFNMIIEVFNHGRIFNKDTHDLILNFLPRQQYLFRAKILFLVRKKIYISK